MLTGTCHCGAVTWTYEDDPGSVTACNCTACAKAGVLWAYGIEGDTVHMHGQTAVYVRKDGGDLEFHRCPTCGNTIAWRAIRPSADGTTQIAVNIRLADAPDMMHHPIRHFDGLGAFRALPNDHRTVKDMWF